MRRSTLLALGLACSPPTDPPARSTSPSVLSDSQPTAPPVPADSPPPSPLPAPSDSPPTQPVPADSPTTQPVPADSPPATPPPAEPVLAAGPDPGLTFHLALEINCPISAHLLAGGGVAFMCRSSDLVGAAAREASLVRDGDWPKFLENNWYDPQDLAGRWPEPLWATISQNGLRTQDLSRVIVYRDEDWHDFPVDAPDHQAAHYTDYADTPDGRTYGLRVYQPADGFYMPSWEPKQKKHEKPRRELPPSPRPHADGDGWLDWFGAPTIDVLLGDGPAPPAFPRGAIVTAIDAGRGGRLLAHLQTGETLHAAPGATAWERLPRSVDNFKNTTATYSLGLDGALYAHACTPRANTLHRRTDDVWTPLPLPPNRCPGGLVVREDGTLLLTHERGALLRGTAAGEWTEEPLLLRGLDDPVQDIDDLFAVPGALWLVATSEEQWTVFTTLPGGTPLKLEG